MPVSTTRVDRVPPTMPMFGTRGTPPPGTTQTPSAISTGSLRTSGTGSPASAICTPASLIARETTARSARGAAPEARPCGVEAHADRLGRAVFEQRLGAQLVAEPARLDAAHRRARRRVEPLVDPHHAGLEPPRDAVGARQIGRPDACAEAVLGGVRARDRVLLVA